MKHILLAIVGLALGLGVGLVYAWVLRPAHTEADPASLRADYRAGYIQLVAQSFAVDGDIDRARTRLAALGEADPAQTVTALAQRTAASGGDPEMVRSLAALASALGARPVTPTPSPLSETPGPATPEALPTTIEPTITLEPTASPVLTATPIPQGAPTQPPTLTLSGAFVFVGKQPVCDPKLGQPLIQIQILSASGLPVPGVEVIVEWSGGFDHFFTGLKPELGNGYGDFTMTEGVDYNVRLAANPAEAITGLHVESCTDAAGRQFMGSWLLVFRQP
jgi:hypothetical protein